MPITMKEWNEHVLAGIRVYCFSVEEKPKLHGNPYD